MPAFYIRRVRGFPALGLLRRLRHQTVSSVQIRVELSVQAPFAGLFPGVLLGLASLVPLLTQNFRLGSDSSFTQQRSAVPPNIAGVIGFPATSHFKEVTRIFDRQHIVYPFGRLSSFGGDPKRLLY